MVKRSLLGLLLLVVCVAASADENSPNLQGFTNGAGQARTFNANGAIDTANPFFQDIGANGRRCVTCHEAHTGWSITPEHVEARFAISHGDDPLFRNNDGSNCEGALPQTVEEKRAAYSLLLTRGLIRVGLDVPPGAEFAIDSVEDPYKCGTATNDVSVYRRPLPTTNLRFMTAIMWDGRESGATTTIEQDLLQQANSATRGHAQAGLDLTPEQARQIVAFEMGLATAQSHDNSAGNLHSEGATGGPHAVAKQTFFPGINDPVGLNPTGAAFTTEVFTLFNAWGRLGEHGGNGQDEDDAGKSRARASILRGQALFNTKPMVLSGVGGLNGHMFPNGARPPASFTGTCTICHDTPNVGNHSVRAPLDIGLTDPAVAPYLPVYTLRNKVTNEIMRTTDPGRAMITGKWADINRFKGPVLRALAARAPYFHNGSAATLEEVVAFYERRFRVEFSAQEKADLLAFLRAL
jgi:cytochrome c peroxidase